MNEMTIEKAYEQISEYFSRDRAVIATGDSGTCKYRVFDVDQNAIAKCAVGCLIPDDKYNPEMDRSFSTQDVLREMGWQKDEQLNVFLCRCQELHDGSSSVDNFIDALDSYYHVLIDDTQ